MPMRTILLFSILLLSACGFHLREQAGMPFRTLHIDASSPNTPLVADLRLNLESNHVQLVGSAEQADVVLNIVSETPSKQILSMGANGRVSEFRLYYNVSLRAYDLKRQIWIPADEIEMRRDLTNDDTKILAIEAEEILLYKSMRQDMVQQIVRLLSHAKPRPQ